MRRALLGIGLAAAVVAGGVFVVRGDGGDVAPRPSASLPSTTAGGTGTGTFDWYAVREVDLGGGWRLVDCEGDGPMVCVDFNGTAAGFLEVASYPVASLPEVRDGLAKGTVPALEAHAAEYLRSMRADRASGCGPGYSFRPEATRQLQVRDGVAITYGFSGAKGNSPVTERTVQWAGIRDGHLVLLTASAYDRGGCLAPEQETSTAALGLFAPSIDRVVVANGLPKPLPH